MDDIRKIIENEVWFHSIDLGNGITTRGQKTPEALNAELKAMDFPDLKGKTVLDIGTYDGFYAFYAEKKGAARIVALDKYVWEYKAMFSDTYYDFIKKNGYTPSPPYKTEWMKWEHQPENLPGKIRFDIAHSVLNSSVEPLIRNIFDDPNEIGTFDIVLFLGVLYHMKDPLGALTWLSSLTSEIAIIETEAIAIAQYENVALCEFFEKDECNGDYSNWWAPNLKALSGLCRAAGFKDIIVKQGTPSLTQADSAKKVERYRLIVHAFK